MISVPPMRALPLSSILVLNHDWRPDRRYDMSDSWVGKITDIRGNSPKNVRFMAFLYNTAP